MHTLTLIALLLAATAIATVHGRRSHQRYEKYNGQDGEPDGLVKCAEKNGATESDVTKFVNTYGKPSDKRELMCVAGCFFEWKKILVDGKFDKEAYKRFKIPAIGEENATKAANYCEAKLADAPTGNCELGGAFYACDVEVLAKYHDKT